MHPRILAVIPTLDDDPTETIDGLLRQTVRVSKTLMVIGLFRSVLNVGLEEMWRRRGIRLSQA